jgi:hypothetical protein
MQSELAKKLKTLLDNMTQEEFDKEWNKIVEQNKDVTTDFKLLLFPIVESSAINFILDLENYVTQMVESNAEYNKKPLKKILKKIKTFAL